MFFQGFLRFPTGYSEGTPFGQIVDKIFGKVFDQKYSFTILPGQEDTGKLKNISDISRTNKNNLENQRQSEKNVDT